MELASGGDLFDKIESDVGVGEDVAHFYFSQLVAAVEFMHARGVAHRDLKPENLLLGGEGGLKVADFGLAALWEYRGEVKLCQTCCGSPPYTAPEVVGCDGVGKGGGGGAGGGRGKLEKGYRGDRVDVWSAGVVLFVLLVGNTPWDEPGERSFEFCEYVRAGEGVPEGDELWERVPGEAVGLLRGMMCVDVEKRFGVQEVKAHPWFRRANAYLGVGGGLENPVGLATEMFESMKIDFGADPLASQRSKGQRGDAMELDGSQGGGEEVGGVRTPTQDIMFDWDRPSQNPAALASQSSLEEKLAEEPSLSQYSAMPQVPMTKTQIARQFGDILPLGSLNRFYSTWPMDQVHGVVSAALHQLEMLDQVRAEQGNPVGSLKIRGLDTRNCPMSGDVVIEHMPGMDGHLVDVSLIKAKGDPVEWRRMFKKVVVLCKDVVFRPDEHMALFSQMSQG